MAFQPPISLTDFSPDSDPRTSGVITECDGFCAVAKGLRVLPSYNPTGDAITDSVTGAYSATLVNGSHLVIAGTAHHLYKIVAGAWSLFDGSAPGDPPTFNGGTNRWSFTTWGNYVLAANGVDHLQISVNNTAFVPLMSAVGWVSSPEALGGAVALVEAVDEGVIVAFKDSDRWAFSISALAWTLGTEHGCVTAVVTGTPGPIVCIRKARGGLALFKKHSMYLGQSVGPPFFWSFGAGNRVSEIIGAVSAGAVVSADDVLYFCALNDFYRFDGATLSPIPSRLKEWFFTTIHLNEQQLSQIIGSYDNMNGIVQWYWPQGLGGTLDNTLILNVRTGGWTKSNIYDSNGNSLWVEAIIAPTLTQSQGFITYERLGQLYHTYANLPPLAYNDLAFGEEIRDLPAIITSNHQLATADGPPMKASFTTGEIGDGNTYVQLNGVRPIFAQAPATTPTLTPAKRSEVNGTPAITGPTRTLNKWGAFTFAQVGRSHTLKIDIPATPPATDNQQQKPPAEITAFSVDVEGAGS